MKTLESVSFIIKAHPNGIVEAYMKPDWDQPDTIEVAVDLGLKLKEAVGNNVCGIMIYAPTLHVKKENLEAIVSIDIGHIANAIIVNSAGSTILANFILKFAKNSIIKKVFTKKEKAEEWLLEQIELAKQKQNNS